MNTNTMDMDDEDDFYSPDEPVTGAGEVKSEEQAQNATAGVPTSTTAEELEEGEEEDEGGAMEEDSDSVGKGLQMDPLESKDTGDSRWWSPLLFSEYVCSLR